LSVSNENRLPHFQKFLAAVLAGLIPAAAGCSKTPAAAETVRPSYDKEGRLTRLEYDSDGDGKIDTWGYMDGARVVRVEVDENGDGIVDRWEYHTPSSVDGPQSSGDSPQSPAGNPASSVGSRQPAVNDAAQKRPGPAADNTIDRIERATRHDGRVSRWEHFENGLLTRVEEDTDADGKVDKWETYTAGALSMMALDSHGRGTPDRRLLYRPDGTLDRIETDPDLSGHFQPLPSPKP
jgi:hypothetical protein